ncbi:hypothetical protein [Aminobacter aminovorans]|uniref:Uncharacterized protein n=1 Tax=Aminobacter aminovorans TaxID=83263 RepID=A0AAC8YWN4_AMIAI|nr:hypothetical protein [Aminobacter aminovorans]AMS45544.1 hypothetical protein AA2016_6654 [Aminobacter aminovorans]MBB3708620.1 hypothetical protein [Aminobacter aminovorans]
MAQAQSNISDFFKTMKVRFEKCLEPTLSCTAAAISAHSVQNATALGLIADDNHVYEMRMRVRNGAPQCGFEKVGRNQASTFSGLCGHHDTEIFKVIDTRPLSLEDKEQLFLIAYRSVTRELHVVMEAAMRLKTTLHRQVRAGIVPKDETSPAMIEATAYMMKSWGVWKHRLEFYDKPMVKRRFDDVGHSIFVIEGRKPVLASSSFFSVDDRLWGKRFAGVTLNVIPTSVTETAVIVSYPKEQSGQARRYVAPVFLKRGDERLVALSHMIVDRAENFFVSPAHLEGWPVDKRTQIEEAFVGTVIRGEAAKPSPELMLF